MSSMRSWQSQRIDWLIELALAMRRRHRQSQHRRRTRGTSASSRPTTRPTFLCPGPFTTSSACPAWAACARRARSRPPTSGP